MNDEIVRFQNALIELLQPHLEAVHDDEKLFPNCRITPISRGEGLIKIRNVEFVCKTVKTDLVHVNDVLSRSNIVFKFHFDDISEPSRPWTGMIESFSIVLEFDDISERTVLLWERYRRQNTWTGRLKLNDEELIRDSIDAEDAVTDGVEYLLFHSVLDHEERSKWTALDSERVYELYDDYREIVPTLRRRENTPF